MSSSGALFFENGRKLPDGRRRVDVESRGFLYGETAFETMLARRGRIFRLADHLERLEESAATLGMNVGLSREALSNELEAALLESGFESASVRLTVAREEGGVGIRIPNSARVARFFTIAPFVPLPETSKELGIRTSLVRSEVLREFPPARGKIGNYVARIVALESARRAGADDALVVSWDGFVLGGATSNVFYFRDGVLETPPLRAGILEGITRRVILEIAREAGLEVREAWISRSELPHVDELFLTSSLRGPIPVRSIDEEILFAEKRPVFALLSGRYERELEALCR